VATTASVVPRERDCENEATPVTSAIGDAETVRVELGASLVGADVALADGVGVAGALALLLGLAPFESDGVGDAVGDVLSESVEEVVIDAVGVGVDVGLGEAVGDGVDALDCEFDPLTEPLTDALGVALGV
jgi:hypothetical protein